MEPFIPVWHSEMGAGKKKIIKLIPLIYQNKLSNRLLNGVPYQLIKNNPIQELKAVWKLKNKKNTEQGLFRKKQNISGKHTEFGYRSSRYCYWF